MTGFGTDACMRLISLSAKRMRPNTDGQLCYPSPVHSKIYLLLVTFVKTMHRSVLKLYFIFSFNISPLNKDDTTHAYEVSSTLHRDGKISYIIGCPYNSYTLLATQLRAAQAFATFIIVKEILSQICIAHIYTSLTPQCSVCEESSTLFIIF